MFDVIEKKISKIAVNAVDLYTEKFDSDKKEALQLSKLGFQSSVNVLEHKLSQADHMEVTRAKLFDYFGFMVLTDEEIKAFEREFKLMTAEATRFRDRIPKQNVKEILDAVTRIRANKLNFGRTETEGFYVPLTTTYQITAPPDMFRKPVSSVEMTAEELIKWKKEDPLVWKKVWAFQPGVYGGNSQTIWNVLITAWGMEAVLINRS